MMSACFSFVLPCFGLRFSVHPFKTIKPQYTDANVANSTTTTVMASKNAIRIENPQLSNIYEH